MLTRAGGASNGVREAVRSVFVSRSSGHPVIQAPRRGTAAERRRGTGHGAAMVLGAKQRHGSLQD